MQTRRIWFKQCYVDQILKKEKTYTVRLFDDRFKVGDAMELSVGPRPPFARAIISKIVPITYPELSIAKQEELVAVLGSGVSKRWLMEVHFEI